MSEPRHFKLCRPIDCLLPGTFRPLVLIAALLVPGTASARSDEQLWTSVSASVKLSDDWRFSEEVVARFSDDRKGLYEIESSTLVGYRLGGGITLWGGYVHSPQYDGGDFRVLERRAREQITVDELARIGGGKLSGRLRLEQRWREGGGGTGWRFRPQLKYSVPLKGKTALNLSSEPFFHLNRTNFQSRTGLDRVRNLVTVSTPLTKTLSGEAGYLNQHGFVRDGEDTSDHVAFFGISLSL
jgi:hypothetical protein